MEIKKWAENYTTWLKLLDNLLSKPKFVNLNARHPDNENNNKL